MEEQLKILELFLQTQKAIKVVMKGMKFLSQHYEPSTDKQSLYNLITSLEAMTNELSRTLLHLSMDVQQFMI